jgi:hypothetical protein
MENVALAKLKEQAKQEDINLDIQQFGLGQEYYLNQYFKQDPTLPDILISTDLEVFENNKTFAKLPEDFINLTEHFTLKESIPDNINWSNKLLPFLVIPLVFYHNDPNVFKGHEPSLESVIKYDIPLTFGGINNSGAKCILKYVHDKYGIGACEKLIKNSIVTNMPIEAFNRVRNKQSSLALVPSVYALRADNKDYFMSYPKEGAIALPSYIGVKKENSKEAIKVLKLFLSSELCNQYVLQGSLFCGLVETLDPSYLLENKFKMAYPSTEYITSSQPEFYQLYEKYALLKK